MTMVVVDVLTLRHLSKEKLREARILHGSDKLHGAAYLSGYAVEHALKYQICKHLGWKTYPPNNPLTESAGSPPQPAWKGLDSFKTHNLQILLLVSGMFEDIFADASLIAAWDLVKNWDSEMRYEKIPNKATERKKIKDILDSSAIVMKALGCGPK